MPVSLEMIEKAESALIVDVEDGFVLELTLRVILLSYSAWVKLRVRGGSLAASPMLKAIA